MRILRINSRAGRSCHFFQLGEDRAKKRSRAGTHFLRLNSAPTTKSSSVERVPRTTLSGRYPKARPSLWRKTLLRSARKTPFALHSPAGMKCRYTAGQILKTNISERCFGHHRRERFLIRKTRNRIRKIFISTARPADHSADSR